jgi:hypothetical protein
MAKNAGGEERRWRRPCREQALVDAGVEADRRLSAGQPHAFDSAPSFGRATAGAAAFFSRRTVSDRHGIGTDPGGGPGA